MDGSTLKVLCVDDNPAVRDALEATLSRAEGVRCVGCLSSAEGLIEAAERERPGVVVMALDMPGPEPFGALRALRDRLPEARVLVFSGLVREDLMDRAFVNAVRS